MDIVTCCVRSRYVQDLLYVGRVFVYFNVKRTLSVSDIRCVIPMWEDVSQLLIQVCMYGPVFAGWSCNPGYHHSYRKYDRLCGPVSPTTTAVRPVWQQLYGHNNCNSCMACMWMCATMCIGGPLLLLLMVLRSWWRCDCVCFNIHVPNDIRCG